MRRIGAQAARRHFAALLDQVESSEEITITRHGRPIARIVPFAALSQGAAIDALQRFSKQRRLGKLRIRDLIREGRRR